MSDGNFATIAGTETLTNKTLTSPTLTTPAVDVINEATSAAGVTVDGVLIKDSAISGQYTPIFRDTAQTTTSGTFKDFTGIPSWVKRITVIFNAVSIDQNQQFLVQLGDAGGIETTGYVSRSSEGGDNSISTAGYIVRVNGASTIVSGLMTIVNVDGNTWISSHAMDRGTNSSSVGGGRKTLSDILTQVRITATDDGITPTNFDNGSVNIIYE